MAWEINKIELVAHVPANLERVHRCLVHTHDLLMQHGVKAIYRSEFLFI